MAQYVESALDLKLKWLERGVGLYLETPRLKVYDDMKSVNACLLYTSDAADE